MTCALTRYCKGDILISNIRPYLKKIWLADSEGGCSTDVLAFRAKNGHSPNYLYALLMQDAFFQYMMQGSKGSKMPRGDKNQIMHYSVPTFSSLEEANIGTIIVDIERKIQINRQINDNLRTSRVLSQTQLELCRGAAVNADISPNLLKLDHSSRAARVRHAA